MTSRFKTPGVVVVALLALAAVMTSAASAKNYTASAYPTTGTGTSGVGNDRLSTEGGPVECASHYQGTLAASSSSLTVVPTYTNCKAFGFLSATVNMNGCDYLFTTASGTAPNLTAPVDVTCPAGKVIEISAGTCKITIPAQKTTGNVAITNQAAGDVLVKANVTGIAFTVVMDGFGCAFFGTGATPPSATYTQANPITFDSTNGANIHIG